MDTPGVGSIARKMIFGRPRAASSPILPVSWGQGELRFVLIVVAVCCLSAFVSARLHSTAIKNELLLSFGIGFSCYFLMQIVRLPYRGRMPVWGVALGIPAGFALGSKLASLAGAPNVAALMIANPAAMRQPIIDTLITAAVITALILYVSHSRGVREALERERRRAAEALQAETAARLALLQAQIEPHFLFNTLANIHSLIEEDPEKASVVLEELNAYLRTSLRRTRQPTSSLGDELELAETLLSIATVRLGRRMGFTISVPDELRSYQLPSLLLQPLVENAIRHGIEPAVSGGTIDLQVRKVDNTLELTVTDTGVGLMDDSAQGVGLSNIRARLESLYGEKGKLALYANAPHGVIAKLVIPAAAA